ncbi:germin-like protein subfamily 1 member 7 [Quercus suber]|uniref:Germin-like protein subfamily 1 member 7 n=1 Tax=Quercus suber TaxID=58331 RepID=A0AAW0JTT2_QUESU
MMKGVPYHFTVAILALATTLVSAYDPSPLQDFCVAINNTDSAVFVNGKFCKDPATVTANDFFFPGLNIPGNTAASKLGSSVNLVNVDKLPGLNTLGISLARLDFAPYGLNPPHTHPRGTELLVVMEGTLLVGFVTSNPNKLFTKVLNKGDVFVFPIGLIHFQFNIGQTNAVAFAGLSSQNPGLITIANAVFGSNPPINPDDLAKAFQLDKNDPAAVTANDFFFSGLNTPANTGNKVGFNVTLVNVDMLPGLNTLGISLARLDFAPYGLDPPHTHPCASKILVVEEGTLLVGFVTSNPNKLFTKVLNKGDVFAFPIGLIHFQFNIGQTNVVAFAGLNSQNPGVITIANTVFGSNPPINPNVLIKAFQFDKNGALLVGFVTSNPNKLFTKVLNKGDVFVFPIGLIHFQFNIGQTNAIAFVGLNSQNPRLITIVNAVFGSNPPINLDVLAKAFQLDKNLVDYLQKQF